MKNVHVSNSNKYQQAEYDLSQWVQLCLLNAKDKGWAFSIAQANDPIFLSAQLMLIVSECSEALEDLRVHGNKPTKYLEKRKVNIEDKEYTFEIVHDKQQYDSQNKPMFKPIGFRNELADIAIRLFHLCGETDTDLLGEVIQKVEYNMTRSIRHGNKNL